MGREKGVGGIVLRKIAAVAVQQVPPYYGP
jgi:hypothetical protein